MYVENKASSGVLDLMGVQNGWLIDPGSGVCSRRPSGASTDGTGPGVYSGAGGSAPSATALAPFISAVTHECGLLVVRAARELACQPASAEVPTWQPRQFDERAVRTYDRAEP